MRPPKVAACESALADWGALWLRAPGTEGHLWQLHRRPDFLDRPSHTTFCVTRVLAFHFFKVKVVYKLCPPVIKKKIVHCKNKFRTHRKKYEDETQNCIHSYTHPQKGLEMLKGDSLPWLHIHLGSFLSTRLGPTANNRVRTSEPLILWVREVGLGLAHGLPGAHSLSVSTIKCSLSDSCQNLCKESMASRRGFHERQQRGDGRTNLLRYATSLSSALTWSQLRSQGITPSLHGLGWARPPGPVSLPTH